MKVGHGAANEGAVFGAKQLHGGLHQRLFGVGVGQVSANGEILLWLGVGTKRNEAYEERQKNVSHDFVEGG